MPEIKLITTEEMDDIRVDKVLSDLNESLSRSYIQKCIDDGRLFVNGKKTKSSYKLKEGDEIFLDVPENIELSIEAENIPIEIVYEDDDVCIVNKPRGMVVHPSAGHYSNTLVNALLWHLKGRLSGINGVLRPGIVHRIDKDTSGLLIICKNDSSHSFIASQLKDHTCNRIYHAIVFGNIKEDEGTVNKPLGRSNTDRKKMDIVPNGKEAITHYKVLERFNGYTYIECRLETGRTHQIRVHMKSLGHPLLGDPVYSTQKSPVKVTGQMLHAKTIGFESPSSHERLSFDSELPEDFMKVLNYLRNNCSF